MSERKRATLWVAVIVVCLVTAGLAATVTGQSSNQNQTGQNATCQIGNHAGTIKHVIYLQFDNVHFMRDVPAVASDLEQIPHLLDFLTSNGTLFTNDHTVLISYTADGILATLTGLYPDRNGQIVSNSYGYFAPNGGNPFGSVVFSSSFKYWTDLVDDAFGTRDSLPNMVTDEQKMTPAPWVPFTRAGCDVGAVATANIVLENTGTGPFGDMTEVFGSGSLEWNEAKATPSRAQTDFVGIAVHCAAGGGVCAGNVHARPDRLPDEPGGYAGFFGLFGAKYVNPAITGGQAAVRNMNGNPITDGSGQPGFPGFDGMVASVSLGYVAQMLEAGIPIVYAYISDAHDNHALSRASGPGEADYQTQLAAYDDAFTKFFARLTADGITPDNSLFVVTVDEGDHFVGGVSPNGIWSHTYCNVSSRQACPANQIGEVTANINALLPPNSTRPTFSIHFASAPSFYAKGRPDRTDPNLRQLERDVAAAKAIDPYVSSSPTPIMAAMVDTVGEEALHMVNADPRRTPTFTLFATPDYFFLPFNTNCPDSAHRASVCIDYHFAWNHGDIQPEIATTWVGFVGPGVKKLGVDSTTWTDHTNVRPTILELLGLEDDYGHDGRVLIEGLADSAVAQELVAHRKALLRLGAVYEQLNAPFGQFGMDMLAASTRALASGSSGGDALYAAIESQIQTLTAQRDALAASIKAALDAAAFGDKALDEQQAKEWIGQAEDLLGQSAQTAGR